MFPDITLCITIGLRPTELRRTLISLSALLDKMPVIAINDFGDEETNEVFQEMVPLGLIIKHNTNQQLFQIYFS